MIKKHTQYDWTLFLNIAKQWLSGMQDSADETLIRCGISRSYYAAFHVCQQYLNTIGMGNDVYGEGSHNTVINDLNNLGNSRQNKNCKKISVDLRRLKTQRVRADYNQVLLSDSFNCSDRTMKNNLEQAIKLAESIINMVKELPNFDVK